MRIGIAVDSATDMGEAFLSRADLRLLPSALRQDGQLRVAQDSAAATLHFLQHELPARGHTLSAAPLSAREFETLLVEQLALEFDYLFLITVSADHSRTFRNAHRAAQRVTRECEAARARHGIPGPFAVRVLDSQSVFTAPAVLAAEATRMKDSGHSAMEIRDRLDALAPRVEVLGMVDDARYLRRRLRRHDRADWSPWWYPAVKLFGLRPIARVRRRYASIVAAPRGYEHAAHRLLDRVRTAVERGLEVPYVFVSYAGDLAELRALHGYADLAASARARRVQLVPSVMRLATAVTLGPRALTAGFCPA